ncbi:MFS transporter [Rhizobium sp. NLR17b]|uniref:MFS transporter n=1 Tax=Rhizobium sp. NLR17b TaxID=2731114 RepID=UPI001C83F3FD|nr:MFS transporter [Rhizobium sp. NLR17b]MBX5273233.1 MFS transporter [Rhizobium sp. NLR17b]
MTLSVCAASMTISIVNVALPTIASALDITPRQSVALVSSFQICMIVALIPLAAVGEILGYKKIYLSGLVVFSVVSLCVVYTQNFTVAITLRAFQGLGAAGILSVNTAMLRFIYPKSQFGFGLGLNAFIAGSATALGPPVATLILSLARWQWLFLANVPICLAALLAGGYVFPKTPKAYHRLRAASVVGHIASSAVILASIQLAASGAPLPQTLSVAVIGVLLSGLYIRHERRLSLPLLPIDLLAIQEFRVATTASILGFAAQTLIITVLPFWMLTESYEAGTIGLVLGAWPAASMVAALAVGRATDRYQDRKLSSIGMLIVSVGIVVTGCYSAADAYPELAVAMTIAGAGFGFFQTPNNKSMLGAAPLVRAGSASGTLGTARVIGQTVGSALAAATLAASASNAIRYAVFLAFLLSLASALTSLQVFKSPFKKEQ